MYDVIHFEALGQEAAHLREEVEHSVRTSRLPERFSQLVTPLTIQRFLSENPGIPLPRLITVKTHSVIPPAWIEHPDTGGVVTRSAGYDHLEHLSRRIHIASLREYCVQAVAQTALKFVYAAAGRLNDYTLLTGTFDRGNAPSFMELSPERRATVFGVGRIGKAICDLLRSNGIDVSGVDIRSRDLSREYGGSIRFVTPEEGVRSADLIVNAMNLTRDPASPFHNVGYFSREFFSLAERPLIFVNVTRGEIAPEDIILSLYDEGRITGIGLDVFSDESGLAESLAPGITPPRSFAAARELIRRSLAREANIYVQPHQGFNSDRAARQKAVEAVRHMEAWYRNGCRRFDEELPYY